MRRLLLTQMAHQRLQRDLDDHREALEVIAMDENGVLALGNEPIQEASAHPDAAWLSEDLFLNPALPTFMRVVISSPRLDWVQTVSAGVDHPMFTRIAAKGARLTNSHGQAIAIAEYVLGEVLAHYQGIAERRRAQADHAWERLCFRELRRTHWLIVGFGAIGQAVAQRVRAFGARVEALRRNTTPHPLADGVYPISAAAERLPLADVVLLSAPLTAATAHLADSAFFRAMKAGSVLINVSRGGLVDERALLEALDAGAPAYAVLDVFEQEPLSPNSRFWDHPRVAISAHASSFSIGDGTRNDEIFLENLARFLKRQPLASEVEASQLAQGGWARGQRKTQHPRPIS
ncbi:MAG: D-2-hydroxyacid dehydrogenase [Caulobacteraceae bacterium]|nr:D-2-hydroxyacid dehydrogenase [Caulobacteraceae bacterium]